VVLKSYQAAAHFTRYITIPEILLNDWASAIAGNDSQRH
jgi:hypothetical protein